MHQTTQLHALQLSVFVHANICAIHAYGTPCLRSQDQLRYRAPALDKLNMTLLTKLELQGTSLKGSHHDSLDCFVLLPAHT